MAFLIVLLALILRLVLINQSLWLDESLEALALMGKFGPILNYALYDFQPPLYHLLGLAWTRLAGYSELVLRLPSLLSGLGLVWFTNKLGQLLGGKKVGIIAGFLTATNPLLIYYSQEGRTYALTAFLVAASFYYLFSLLKGNQPRNTFFLYFLFTLLALWTSYIAWIVIGLQVIYCLVKRQRRLVFISLAAFSTLLLWLPSLLRSLGIGLSTATHSPEWGRVVGEISIKALALTWVKMNLGRISFDNNLLYGAIVLLLLALHVYLLRHLKKPHPLLIIWLFGPIIIASLVSFVVPVYSYFRVLFVVPAYLLLLALALAKLNDKFSTLLIASQLCFLILFWFSPRFHREDWRALTAYLNRQPEGIVGMPSLNQSAPLTYYQLNKPLFEPKNSLNRDYRYVYYLKYVEDLFDTQGQAASNLSKSGYGILAEYSFTGLQLITYEKTP